MILENVYVLDPSQAPSLNQLLHKWKKVLNQQSFL